MWNWNYTNVNDEFFKIWSPELSYVVGLFLADGHISNYDKSGKKNVIFSNSTPDRDMLEKVAGICGYKNRVLDFKSGMSRIQFAGDFIWNFFTDLGFDNNKTFTADVPKPILECPELHSHFIRGVFDGDGSVSVRKRRKEIYPCSNVVGTLNIMEFISNKYTFCNTCKPHRSIHRVTYDGGNAVRFLNEIYKDSTIHMDRKYNKFSLVKDWKTTCKRWTAEEKDFVRDNYLITYAKDIAVILNKSPQAVSDCAKRLGIKRQNTNGKI